MLFKLAAGGDGFTCVAAILSSSRFCPRRRAQSGRSFRGRAGLSAPFPVSCRVFLPAQRKWSGCSQAEARGLPAAFCLPADLQAEFRLIFPPRPHLQANFPCLRHFPSDKTSDIQEVCFWKTTSDKMICRTCHDMGQGDKYDLRLYSGVHRQADGRKSAF